MTLQMIATYFIGAATASIVAVIINQRLIDTLKKKKAELRHMVRQAHEQDIKIHEATTQFNLMRDRYKTLSSDYETVMNIRNTDKAALAILQEDFERLKFEYDEANAYRERIKESKRKYQAKKGHGK